MSAYLDSLEHTVVGSPEAAEPAPIWLAAHGPGPLLLAGNRADGANTYLMPPSHTREARKLVGRKTRLNVLLPCCLCEDETHAREIGRRALAGYLPLPAYRGQRTRWGFTDADFEDGGSDRLIDAAVAWVGRRRSAGASRSTSRPARRRSPSAR